MSSFVVASSRIGTLTGYPKTTQQPLRWTDDNSFCVGTTIPAGYEAHLLDTTKYDGVTTALAALNAGVVSSQSFCLVFSRRKQVYYLLWRSGQTESEVENLKSMLMGRGRTLEVRDESFSSGVLSKVGRGHSFSSGLSTADTTPERKTSVLASPQKARIISPNKTVRANDVTPSFQRPSLQPTKHQTGADDKVSLQTASRKRGSSPNVGRLLATRLQPLEASDVDEMQPAALPGDVLNSPRKLPPSADIVESLRELQPSAAKAIGRKDAAKSVSLSKQTPPSSTSTHRKVSIPPARQVSSSNDSTSVPDDSASSRPRGASSVSCLEDMPLMTTTTTKEIYMVDATKMTTEDFQLDQSEFDPSRPQLKARLLEKLGLESAVVEKLIPENAGGFNDGIWIVSNARTVGLVLKLVPRRRQHDDRKTDAEKYHELQGRCPNILAEFSLTFPVKILRLKEPSGAYDKDLIVMRKAMGMQMTQHLFEKFHAGREAELPSIFQEFGRFMKTIHLGYKGMQHGDCQPSNVFYDEVSRCFTLVDVADFGFGPFMAQGGENDVAHFVDGLRTLTQWYGQSLIENCAKHFQMGYGNDAGPQTVVQQSVAPVEKPAAPVRQPVARIDKRSARVSQPQSALSPTRRRYL
jgi:tRNA A-37 threonylcarbamoyl transferase component Bud32|mmetsp:Transcript_766/g.1224  ORF Transcript_766/g.1224 Transcript_766/m.1224 type:complete len:636 (+) Transcript_766:64-1971(+)